MASWNLIGKTLGEYQILEEIGCGGMAVVYRAWQPSLARTVALKVLPPQFTLDASFVQRFRHEAKAAAQLQHRHIVPIFTVGEQDGIHYIAMSYVDGPSLDLLLRQEGALSLARTVALATQVADALDYAHGQGLVHRDVKPANILIGAHDQVMLTDFGLVKALAGTGLTKTGVVMGTPAYMAPEQVWGRPVGPAADLYALGIVLYEMLTGRVPFGGDTPVVLHAHAYDPPPPPTQLKQGLPPGVDGVFRRALAKDPLQRFATAGEMVAALASVGRGKVRPVPSRRQGAASPGPPLPGPTAPGQRAIAGGKDKRRQGDSTERGAVALNRQPALPAATAVGPPRSEVAPEGPRGACQRGRAAPEPLLYGPDALPRRSGNGAEATWDRRHLLLLALAVVMAIVLLVLLSLLAGGRPRTTPGAPVAPTHLSPAQTGSPSAVPVEASTPVHTATAIPSTATSTAMPSPTPSPSRTSTFTPALSRTPTRTVTPRTTATVTATPKPSATPTARPTASPTGPPTATPVPPTTEPRGTEPAPTEVPQPRVPVPTETTRPTRPPPVP